MKVKLLPLVLMFMLAVSVAQPIFAVGPQLEDTKIAGTTGQPLKNISVHSGDSIELQARLYWYWYTIDSVEPDYLSPKYAGI